MPADKTFPLSITLRAVDKATSNLKRINEEIDKSFKPFRSLKEEFGKFGENAGFDKIAGGFGRISGAVKSLALGVGSVIAAGVGASIALKGVVDEFDDLGDSADRLGLDVDVLAQLRHAAIEADAEVGALDSSFQAFNKNLGQLSAGTGRFAKFLKRVSPALFQQVKGAKSSEEAFGLLADAMAKLESPAKRAALAAAAGFDETLIPLLAKGKAGIAELRAAFAKMGSVKDAVKEAGELDEAWKALQERWFFIKVEIVKTLGPVFTNLIQRVTAWIDANRATIAAWAADFAEKLPGRIQAFIDALKAARDAVMPIVNGVRSLVGWVGGAENAVRLMIGAWVAFQGLKLLVGIFQIGQGLAQMAVAARAASAAMGGVGVAAGVIGKIGAGGAALAAGYGVGTWASHKLDLNEGDEGYHDDFRDPVHEAHKRRMRARRTLGAGGAMGPKPAEANVTVKFENAPRGTRVSTDPRSTADVDLSVGHQMVMP